MKHLKKIFSLFLAICVFASFSCVATFASISSINIDLSGKQPFFTWSDSSESGSVYAIRGWYDAPKYSSAHKAFYVTGLKNPSCKTTFGLQAGKTCTYQIASYSSKSSPDWKKASTKEFVIPSFPEIAAPHSASATFTYKDKATNKSKLGEIVQKDNSITIKWSVDDPTAYARYEIARMSDDNKTNLIATIKSSSKKDYSYKYLSPSGKYEYEIRAYISSADSNCIYIPSERVSAPKVAANMLTTSSVRGNLWWTATAKKDIKLYSSPGKDAYTTMPKGTTRWATWEFSPKKMEFWDEPKWVQITYKGKYPWAKWSQVKMKYHVTKKDYPWSVKDKFINSGKWKSKTNYIIWINRYCQRTNIFKKDGKRWELIKVYDCNTGNYYQPLKGGQYYVKSHVEKVEKDYRDEDRQYYFLYSTKFGGSGSFHTRCRWSDTDNFRNSIKRHPTTKGCDRLYDAAAKYVYNLPIGTGVVIR